MLLLCRFWVLKRVARSQLPHLFNDGSDNAALLSWFFLKMRSVRILDTIVCSGSSVWMFSPVWELARNSELAPGLMFDNFLAVPDAESLPFYPLVLKLVVCAPRCENCKKLIFVAHTFPVPYELGPEPNPVWLCPLPTWNPPVFEFFAITLGLHSLATAISFCIHLH